MRSLLKRILEIYIDLAAFILGISFPAKYNWKWKLDVLLRQYEPETTRAILKELKRDDVFVDIGAHIGYFTRLAAKRVGKNGRVVAFEADTENFALLEKNTRRFLNVTRVPDAIGDKEGRATFYHVRGSSGCHSLIQSDSSESYEVSVTTLDAYVEKSGITVNMIKMDIEGGEWNALGGMQKVLQTPGIKLILEYNPEALSRATKHPHDLVRLLLDEGFSMFIIRKNRLQLSRDHIGLIDQYLEAGSVNIYCTKAVLR